ncbi:MAG: ribosome maturation factor RimM [Pseudomonadota bacterium]|nr:ribosome maturation factor RimM [Pseudomonadota bacterium]
MAPRDLIELGAVRGAYGLKGWVRIAPFAAEGVVLENVRRWWLLGGAEPLALTVEDVKRHTESILAKWAGCESKEAADALKGATIAVPRSDFPALDEDEHYLSDMVGYRVINRQGLELGTICGIRSGDVESRSTAAAQWLEVSDGDPREALLIPLVDRYVEAIEPESRLIRVDWESNW